MTQDATVEGSGPIVYQAALPVSSSLLRMITGLLRQYLKDIGSRWRAATPGRQAILALAWLRHDQRLADLAGGNEVSASTIRRWGLDVIRVLADKAPRLDRVLARLAVTGATVVLVDGTLIPTRRRTGTANRPNYSGKHKHHGLNVQALTDIHGRLLWLSPPLPGKTADITAARRHRLLDRLHHHGLAAIADKGYQGWHKDLRGQHDRDQIVLTPYKAEVNRPVTDPQRTANTVLNGLRSRVETGFATLKTWRILNKLRLHTRHASTLLRALLVLIQHEQRTRHI
ncbi:transposase [Amycolatopsis sp. cmx-11-12]|uniref:transposase n=1 Tax=Amycolatopsis sp. cmx-11-12 TaxID=2785795 RepID=UPI003917DCD4